MKHSIAKIVTRQVSLILLVTLTVLSVSSFLILSYTIYAQDQKYARAITTVFSDLIVYEAEKKNIPIDENHTDDIIFYGNYICKWYKIDYTYIYKPDLKNKLIKYVCVAQNESHNGGFVHNHLIGENGPRRLNDDEIAVWNGEKVFACFRTNTAYGNEISTVLLIKDSFGNKYLAGVDIPVSTVYNKILSLFLLVLIINIAVILGIYFLVYRIIHKKVSEPAQLICRNMREFIADENRSCEKVREADSYEYATISESFNIMSANITDYLNNIKSLTLRQEHQKTELAIASEIQKGFLPKNHLLAEHYEVHTLMLPAKDVGGDLYDYLQLDNNRVLMVIADVSGKGISAAIFMAVTLTLIRQYAKMDLSPSEILKNVNEMLSENNSHMLFATAFVGIYDKRTKELTYSSAGHNLPYIITGSKLYPLGSAQGTVIGLYENEKYQQAKTTLNIGDTLFMYTDGVTESINSEKHFYGIERLEKNIYEFKKSHADNIVSYIYDTIREFSGDIEQYDDITMLALTIKDTIKLSLDVDINEFPKIREVILSLPLSRDKQLSLCLASEECFANICSHAFPDGIPDGEKITVSIYISDRIFLQFCDGGRPFNPLETIYVPEDYDLDTQIGGLGKFITVSIVDDIKYEYRDGKNVLTLIKYFEEEIK